MKPVARRKNSPATPLAFHAFLILAAFVLLAPAQAAAQEAQNLDPVTMSVVVANPSKDKAKTIPVKIDLPMEVKPEDILEHGDLKVAYDDSRSVYFLVNEAVELAPQETKVFNVIVKNVWVIEQLELDELRTRTEYDVKRLEGTAFQELGAQIAASIYADLQTIVARQADDSLGQKQRIGAYRLNRQLIDKIREALEKLEKMMTQTGAPPVPDFVEKKLRNADAPSTKTTWFIIYGVMFFSALLVGALFISWMRQSKAEKMYYEHGEPMDSAESGNRPS